MKLFVCLLALVAYVAGDAIDNGVEGPPEIECGSDSITVNFNTQQNFVGHVYVKGLYDTEGCKTDATDRQVAGITISFDACNTVRERSLNPKGVFVHNTIIVSFHPSFLTKIDKAYRIQCFYMEADKTVSTELEVSMLTTAFQTQQVLMPVCRYDVLDGGPQGEIIKFALVGQQVFHKWVCDTETQNTFCMAVYSCFVDDGAGNQVELIDADGCAVDRFLLNNIEYGTALMGGVQAHVFKYADKSQLFFQCQIRISVREPTGAEDCSDDPVRATCSTPPGRGGAGGALFRKKRSTYDETYPSLDVRTHVNALDIDDEVDALPNDLAHKAPKPRFQRRYPAPVQRLAAQSDSGICMSPTVLFSFLALSVALAAAVVTVGSCLLVRRSEK